MREGSHAMLSKYEDQIMSTVGRLSCTPLELMERFYKHLFETAPEVSPYFEADMSIYYQELLDAFLLVINSFDDLPELAKELEEMGRQVGFGTQRSHYEAVGHSLVFALSKSVQDWTLEDEKAWITIYNYISNTMIEGASYAKPVKFQL
jgi:hemoglobin-like flavoprotein